MARVQRVCIVDKDRVRRDVQGDNRDVNGKYLRKALTGLDDEISKVRECFIYVYLMGFWHVLLVCVF